MIYVQRNCHRTLTLLGHRALGVTAIRECLRLENETRPFGEILPELVVIVDLETESSDRSGGTRRDLRWICARLSIFFFFRKSD